MYHTEDTSLTMQVTFFHPRHGAWFLNKSRGYVTSHRDTYKPRVIFIPMQYSAMSGNYVDITPEGDVVFSMTRDEAWFRMDDGHVCLNESVTVHQLAEAHRADGNSERCHFRYRRMTEGDRFLLELTVSYHGDRMFTIHDVRLRGHRDTCKFLVPEQ